MRASAIVVALLAFFAIATTAAQPRDHIDYSDYSGDPVGMMRTVLADTVANGLIGDHHYFFEFRTAAPGVEVPPYLAEKHPDKIVIVLQYQFWDLAVSDTSFSVTLAFDEVRERLTIPFSSVTWFSDPSVNFEIEVP